MCDPAEKPAYFPPGLFDDQQKIDQSISAMYSGILMTWDEPSIWELSRGKEAQFYRFLWIGTWRGPVIVRLEINADGTACLYGWGPTGSPSCSVTKVLSKEQSEEFFRRIAVAGFWSLPTRGDRKGTDGANWIFEGAQDGRYHVVERWSPGGGPDGPVRDLGLYFLSLSGFPIAPEHLY